MEALRQPVCHYIVLEVLLQRHKRRRHSEQPLELTFPRLDQCGGALLKWGDAGVSGAEDKRPNDGMEQSLKWVGKSLGFDEDVEAEVRDIMKTKEDSLPESEVRHSCSSLIYVLNGFYLGLFMQKFGNGWQMKQWLGRNLRHKHLYLTEST